MIQECFKKFRRFIEDKEYFKAHEVLVPLWIEYKKQNHPDKELIRAFINAAVACELHKRGRKSYRKPLCFYKKHSDKIASQSKYIQMKNFLDAICYNLKL